MPANRRPPDQRQDNRDGRAPVIAIRGELDQRDAEPPDLPYRKKGTWLKRTRQIWEDFWTSEITAQVADRDLDVPKLWRWITYWDEWFRTMDTIREQGRMSVGSTGQPVLSPLISYLKDLEDKIANAEKQFGIGAYSRNQLGLVIGQGQLTAAEINARIQATMDADDEDQDDDELLELDGDEWVEAPPS